jgi:hypothetical protein
MFDLSLDTRLRRYCEERCVLLKSFLGDGTDGRVYKTDRPNAVKVFKYPKNFYMELRCYQRLRDRKVHRILDFTVPRLLNYHETFGVIEMETVTPPCILDFGKCYLDSQPEHSAETWRDHHESQRELWEDRYSTVQRILGMLKSHGIYYQDPKPGNIIFE